mmetsp:Transcript_5118/g.14880  ORF Transcript_5118/g.14880 Transcript_5118/m.14880 type:complete len:119 (+) Transcript_5118:1344-1700(+)
MLEDESGVNCHIIVRFLSSQLWWIDSVGGAYQESTSEPTTLPERHLERPALAVRVARDTRPLNVGCDREMQSQSTGTKSLPARTKSIVCLVISEPKISILTNIMAKGPGALPMFSFYI